MEISTPDESTAALLKTIEDSFFKAAAEESLAMIGEPTETLLERLAVARESERLRETANTRAALLAGNLTKAERRLVAREHAIKSSQQPWVDLVHYRHIQAVVKSNRSGRRACACGQLISATKTQCRACRDRASLENVAK